MAVVFGSVIRVIVVDVRICFSPRSRMLVLVRLLKCVWSSSNVILYPGAVIQASVVFAHDYLSVTFTTTVMTAITSMHMHKQQHCVPRPFDRDIRVCDIGKIGPRVKT